MVVLAAAICTKPGKPLISRQFRPLPKSRIDGLLASFPKLIPPGSQHTTVETSDVRFVYQPFDDLYVLLITNKNSNILQDINTLSLVVRVITSLSPSMSEYAILANSFELLGAFDEIVSLGYKENASLQQIRNVLEGESHEEKIQEIIARNKEAEAKEELKRRAKQLEMQRREQQRLNQASGRYGGSTNLAQMPYSAPNTTAYPSASTPYTGVVDRESYRSNATAPTAKPVFKSSGMQLGKKGKQADLLDVLGSEAALAVPNTKPSASGIQVDQPTESLPVETPEASTNRPFNLALTENINAVFGRDGALQTFDVKGQLDIRINDQSWNRISVDLTSADDSTSKYIPHLQFQQHPNIRKFTATEASRRIALRDPARTFPIGQKLAVLRWRLSVSDDKLVPCTLLCWPSLNDDGTMTVNVEFDATQSTTSLQQVEILVTATQACNIATEHGHCETQTGKLIWFIGDIDGANRTGSCEFTCSGSDIDSLYPIVMRFRAESSVVGIDLQSIGNEHGTEDLSTLEMLSAQTRDIMGDYRII